MNLKKVIKKIIPAKKKPASRPARIWSNKELKKIGSFFDGDVINVSAWNDEDKQGGMYRDYFCNARSYKTSNYAGWRGEEAKSDYIVDLVEPLPDLLINRFDVVFNHTTLEHIYDAQRALQALAELSRDSIVIVVPFVQQLHGPNDGDFWRFSPYAMRRMLSENGFDMVYESAGPEKGRNRYLFCWASRDKSKWKGKGIDSGRGAEAVLRDVL